MNGTEIQVGRVLQSSTRSFAIGCTVMRPDIPAFGSFVRAEGRTSGHTIYGLIYDVGVEDDPFVRQFIRADTPDEVVLDQRDNRQVPIEVRVLVVGCGDRNGVRYCLAPQPPVTLDWLYQCSDPEIQAFTERFDYFRLILEAREVPADELLAASLRAAAAARPAGAQEAFLLDAGRELARLLAGDPTRLEGLIHRLRR